jgi:hypothetical protein
MRPLVSMRAALGDDELLGKALLVSSARPPGSAHGP